MVNNYYKQHNSNNISQYTVYTDTYWACANYVSPLYTEGETYRLTSHRSFLCHISFVSVRSVLSVYHVGGQTRDVDPISGYC